MYFQSNSFLGGANAGRHGQPGGQQGYGGQPSPFAPQQTAYVPPQMQPQQTGYAVPQLQPQHTAYAGPQLQPQQTGYGVQIPQQYPGMPMQAQMTGVPPQAQPQQTNQQLSPFAPQQTGYGAQPPQIIAQQPSPQYTGFGQQQQQQQQAQPAGQTASPLQSVKTGMTSSQMAESLRASTSPRSGTTAKTPTRSNRIPSIRLSFITAADQSKFEQLFLSAVGNDGALSGDKAKDLLLRSKLSGDALSQIWTLSDTTKSGQLLFPEFALSMYLCNLKLTGKTLPNTLPERVQNEVSSMVDIISFGIPDDRPMLTASNAPSFSTQRAAPQPQQPSNTQILSQFTAQPAEFQPQQTGFAPQSTGLQPHQTGFLATQPTGYGMASMATGYVGSSFAPLNAQPTGRPGQWGLVNAPSAGLPNLNALQQQMMPQPGREQGFTTTGLRGNATVPWAVTKDEKKIYDDMFKAWDGFGKGFITGSQALEIFGQSGLDKPDLERIWTLSDSNDNGRLNLDEFAVAMHLIYRRLNDYPVPDQLPPELVPPSTRNINASIGTVKSMLSRDAQDRKGSGSFLQPQRTGVSYLKTTSFHSNGSARGGKDGTVYKHDDDHVVYKSSARRRGPDGRSPTSPQPDSLARQGDMTVEQLKKAVREKQILLDASDFQDENAADQEDVLDRKDRREADELYERIRRVQEDIDRHPGSGSRSSDGDAERRTMQRQLRNLGDRLPTLASQVRKCERAIADAQVELFRLKDAKAHPNSASSVVGTGPNGEVTDSDRLRARAKAMMQQRSAALAGKASVNGDDGASAAKRLEEENTRVRREMEDNERMVKDVEESVSDFSKAIETSLKEGRENATTEHERRRWEDGLGVEDEVKTFIFDLQRDSRATRIRREESVRPRDPASSKPSELEKPVNGTSPAADASKSYSSYKTAEERAAFIKQQAAARMAERLAALDLKGPGKSETPQQKQERERKEARDRLKREEEEDARREQARQQRLADESVGPPVSASISGKKPAPPAPRKRGGSLQQQQEDQSKAEAGRAKQQIAEQALVKEQQNQIAETKDLENEERRQEAELEKEQAAARERMLALEEQVRQGKIQKEEERKRKKEAQRASKEKEARLDAQRRQIEEAKEKERQLREQLDKLGDEDEDSSSDDDVDIKAPEQDPVTSTHEIETPPPAVASPAVRPMSSGASGVGSGEESRNPFFKNLGQPAIPQAAAVDAQQSTNPFHRPNSQGQQTNVPALPEIIDTSGRSRTAKAKDDDDDWSAMESSDSSEEEEDRTGSGSAKHLASLLFGSMAPPKPLSSMGTGSSGPMSPPPVASAVKSPLNPASTGEAPSAAPPPPPPPPPPAMAQSTSPPPPPPMPGAFESGAPAVISSTVRPAAPAISGLLGEIQAGKGLRKTQTKDRSVAGSAGRVLD